MADKHIEESRIDTSPNGTKWNAALGHPHVPSDKVGTGASWLRASLRRGGKQERYVTTALVPDAASDPGIPVPDGYPGIPVPDGFEEESTEKRIGRIIHQRRRDLSLTQAQVATRMGVSRGLVAQWEAGSSRLMLKDVDLLAQVLQTKTDYLLGKTLGVLDNAAITGRMSWSEARMLHQRSFLLSLFDGMTGDERDELIRVGLQILEANDAVAAAEGTAVR